jgi:outer membrane immunogenic protein
MYRFLKISLVAAALVSAPVVAEAADPGRPPPYRGPVPYYDWSGFYVGAHIGFGSTDGETGFLGGGQVGFNHQIGQWVFGVEGQISATSIKESASATIFDPQFGFITGRAEARLDWISTLAVRAGWAFDRWLVYGKVGAAWAHVSADAVVSGGGMIVSASADDTVSGWVLGFGTEYALQNNWTAKIEYNMMDFGNDLGTDATVHVFKAGVNYRFGLGKY